MRIGIPAALLVAYGGVHRLGMTYGSTAVERRAAMPGDGIVASPRFVVTHAATIDAPVEDVWPWLVQMGWHRGGWYTARWVDRLLFPANRASADRILEDLQAPQVGDFVPDGPPEAECGFVIERIEPQRLLVLHSTSHLPLAWRRRGIAAVNWTWVFSLVPRGARTRLIFRWRAATRPWWFTIGTWLTIVPADLLMSRDMLQGIRHRSEDQARRPGHSTA